MKYSYNWLQNHIQEKLPAPESLRETIIFHAFEVESGEEKNGDYIFDIKVLPDRAGDCLSHYGMAREIAGLLKLTLNILQVDPLPNTPLALPVEVKSDLCRRYIAVQMDEVTIAPSPAWLKNALESVGQRSINNVVDATNYILLDTGQPTHAFDAAKVDEGIVVRFAHEGETIITLSEETKTLSPDMLVISDYVGAIAIAGVKGGKTAEIGSTEDVSKVSSPDTIESLPSSSRTSVILEIANFDPTTVRTTARALGLHTDAVKRFENNLSPDIALFAARQLVALIKKVAGGTVTGVHDHYTASVVPGTITFSLLDVTRLLGTTIDAFAIEDVFDAYHYTYTKDEDIFVFTVPDFRRDIIGVHDIAEEIGRVIGYNTIASKPLPMALKVDHSTIFQSMQGARAYLSASGYREVMNYTFAKNGEVYVVHGPKDKSALRTSLSDGIKKSYELNCLYAPVLGATTIKLFEIGTVFFDDREEIHVAVMEDGRITEVSLEAFVADHTLSVHPVLFDQSPAVQPFVPWSVYPYISRDVAVWVHTDQDKARYNDLIDAFAAQYCVRAPVLFDEFGKDGRTSVAYRLVFQAYDRTLTESEVEGWFAILIERIGAEKVFDIR